MGISKLFKFLLFRFAISYAGEEDGGGAVLNENGEAVGTNNDARVAMLNSIGNNNDQARAEELQSINDDGSTSAFELENAADQEAANAEQQAAIALAAEQEAAAAAANGEENVQTPQKHRIKVNGREMELTLDELVTRAQKIESADQYLADAARIRNELAANKLPKSGAEAEANAVQDDLALVRAIQMGSEEEALQAIRKLKDNGPSKDDLTRTIDERLTFNEAINKFNSDFKDIVSDPYLHKLALDTDAQLVAQGDNRSYNERYTAIGNDLRSWMKSKAPAPAEAQVVNKEDRKAAATAVPKTASAKTESTVQEEKEESTSDVIASIARQRGGPQWMQVQGASR